jgi:hypothetical protein
VLGHRHQLADEQVLRGHHAHRHRLDLALLAALDHLVGDLEPGGMEDEVDHHVAVPGLVQPLLGWLLRAKPGVLERGERAIGILGLDQKVEVVVGVGPAAHPRGDAPGDEERDAGVSEGGG